MACDPKVYNDISPEIMDGLRRELANIELTLPEEDEGILHSSAFGVSANYKFDRTASTLRVEVTSKPFFVPCSYIFKKLDEAFERARQIG